MNEFYVVYIETWSYEWSRCDRYYFKDKETAEHEKDSMLHKLRNTSKRGTVEKISFDELKEMATVQEFEDLFNINISDKLEIKKVKE